MSFANIGKLLSAGTDYNQLSRVVTSIGDVNKAAVALNATGLSSDVKIGLLAGNFAGVNADAARAALGISSVTDAAGDATIATSNFGYAMRGAGKSASNALVAFAKTPLGIAAITAAAIALVAVLVKALPTQEKLNETAQKSADAYQSTITEIESLNSELKTTVDRMNELESKDSLTVVEEEEYAKLQQTNKELELQIQLKEKVAQMQAKEAAKDAANALTSKMHYRSVLGEEGTGTTENATHSVVSVEQVDIIDRTSDEIDRLNELQANRIALMEEINNIPEEEMAETFWGTSDYELKMKQLDHMETEISNLETSIAEKMGDISTLSDSLYTNTGSVAEGYEDLADRVDYVSTKFSNLGEVVDEDTQHLEEFFSSKSGSYLKDELTEIAKESKSSEEVLESFIEAGLSLENIDVSEEGFKRYFEDIITSAEETKEVINSVEGTVQAVTDAFESENKNKNWIDMSDYLDKAKDLFEDGLIGTDDFKTAVQFISPDIIDADNGYKYDADAYVKAWQDAKNKVKRYFDKDNPLKSMYNFSEDLVKGGLATKVGDEYTWGFKTSAQAAEKLGLSLEAVEVIMRSLEAYGAEFDGVKFSGEMLSDYETALNGIKTIAESIEDEELKQEMKLKIKGWEEEYSNLSENLEELGEEQVIKIKFEYDLATIQAQIEEFQNRYNETGSAEDQASINIAKRRYRETREEQVKYNENSGDSAYSASYGQIESLQSQLKLPETSEETKTSLREQISLIYDMQNAFLDFRAEGGTLDWSDYLNSDEGQTVLSDLVSETELSVEQIEELLGSDLNLKVKTEQPEKIETEDVVIEATLDAEELSRKLASAKAGTKIVFTAEVDGVEREITAVKNEDGTVTYTANVDGLEKELEVYQNTDGTVNYSLGTQAAPLAQSVGLDYIRNYQQPPVSKNTDVNYIIGTQENPKDKVAKVTYVTGSISGVGSSLAASSATGTLLSPAHASGTAYNVLNMIPAYSNGKVSLSQDETALVNELGTESLIRDGKWFLIPGGMHTENLKKGDIVLSASQTKQLLNYGRASGHGHSYAYGTLSNAYANGWNPFGSLNYAQSIGGKNNQKSNSKSSSNSSSSSDSEAENFNWIEVALSRIQRLITNVGKTVSATYKKWSERNKAIGDEISLITDEIALQKRAYEKYMELADGVGLSEHYKKLVQSGAIDYESISDKNLAEQIKKYQEFFEAALDCVDAVQDLEDELASLAKQEFDNVVSEYENQLSSIEHRIEMLEGQIDLTEEKGHIVSASFYENIIAEENKRLETLESQYDALIAAREAAVESGIVEGSEDWNEMTEEIRETESSILDVKTAIVEAENALRELEWDKFDRRMEERESLISESDFLKDILSYEELLNENGSYTDSGRATQGLNALNMNAYYSQAQEYRKELEKIEELLKEDPENTYLLERKSELQESYRDSTLSALDATQEMFDLEEERYDNLLSYMDELINKEKDRLQIIEDQYDYEKSISEKVKDVTSLEKQLKAYEGDDSEASRATIQKLKVSLEEARTNLEDAEREKYIQDQEKLYDELYSKTEEWIDARLKNQAGLLQDIIAATNLNTDVIKLALLKEAGEVGVTLSDKMNEIWSTDGTFMNAVTEYQNGLGKTPTTTNGVLASIDKNHGFFTGANGILGNKNSIFNYLNSLSANQIKSDNISTVAGMIGSVPANKLISTKQLQALRNSMLVSPSITDGISKLPMTSNSSNIGNIENHVDLNVTLPNVSDYNQFKTQLLSDSQVQSVIQNMTLGAMTGKNSLSKFSLF